MSRPLNSYNGAYGPLRSTKSYLKAPITTLETEGLPTRLDFLTGNRGRPPGQDRTDAWDFTEAEFQLLELRGDGVLYDELPGILRKSYPNINANGITRLRQILVTNNILSHLTVVLRLDQKIVIDGRDVCCPQPQKRLADMFEAYVGALWEEAREALHHLPALARMQRQEILVAWLAHIFSPGVFPDIGIDQFGKVFGADNALRHSRLNKSPRRILARQQKDARRMILRDGSRPEVHVRPSNVAHRTARGRLFQPTFVIDDENDETATRTQVTRSSAPGHWAAPEVGLSRPYRKVSVSEEEVIRWSEVESSEMEFDSGESHESEQDDDEDDNDDEDISDDEDTDDEDTDDEDTSDDEVEEAIDSLEAQSSTGTLTRRSKLDDDDDEDLVWMHKPGVGWVCVSV